MMKLLYLGILWILWCTVHSLMISLSVIGLLTGFLGDIFRYYRLFYNITAVITLIPLVVLTRNWRGDIVFVWQGYWQILQFLMCTVAALLFWAGSHRYDMGYFLGVRQIRSGKTHTLISETEEFSTTGVFGVTRHPWYLGSLLLIWSILPAYSASELIVAVILSVYLIIGTVLEERKLVVQYGDAYRTYQRQVSMLLPWKW